MSPMGFETIEHTADVGIRAWAGSLSELFAEAARALMAVMGRASGPATAACIIDVEAPDLEALIEAWLSEVLFVFEVRGMAPSEFDVDVQEHPWRVTAEVRGPPAEQFEQEGPAVKAVTYHDLSVRSGPEGWEARVYLDV